MDDGAKREVIELRCPNHFGKLLGKVISAGYPLEYDDDNLLELPCADCKRMLRRSGKSAPKIVLHKFNMLGELIESESIQ